MKTNWQTWCIIATTIFTGFLATERVYNTIRAEQLDEIYKTKAVTEARKGESEAKAEARKLLIQVKELQLEAARQRNYARNPDGL